MLIPKKSVGHFLRKISKQSRTETVGDIENLKIAAQTYQEVSSITELEQKISILSETEKSVNHTLVKVERCMKDIAEIIK